MTDHDTQQTAGAPQSFEESLARLEAITQALETGDPKLEQALALFEEGVGLARTAQKRLDEAEKKLEILLEDDRVEPFEPDASAG